MKSHACFALLMFAIVGCSSSTSTNAPSTATVATPASATVDRVCEIAAEQMGVGESKVDANTSLADLGADELDLVELVMELEDEFSIAISDAKIEQMSGGGDLSKGFGKLTMRDFAKLVDD